LIITKKENSSSLDFFIKKYIIVLNKLVPKKIKNYTGMNILKIKTDICPLPSIEKIIKKTQLGITPQLVENNTCKRRLLGVFSPGDFQTEVVFFYKEKTKNKNIFTLFEENNLELFPKPQVNLLLCSFGEIRKGELLEEISLKVDIVFPTANEFCFPGMAGSDCYLRIQRDLNLLSLCDSNHNFDGEYIFLLKEKKSVR
jgi:hypothetical protein